MKTYMIIKLIITLIFVLAWTKIAGTGLDLIIAVFALIDFTLLPIGYLIYSFIRKKKLAPGEYKVKPEGKQL